MSLLDTIAQNPLQTIIGVLTIATALYIYHKNKKTKSFRYSILTDLQILTAAEELSGKIKIYYEEGQDKKIEIKDGSLLIINIVNDGNVPIKSEDFEEPVSISFNPKADILSAEVIKTSPATLKPKLDVSKNEIVLEPLLLNEKDSITIKTLLMGFRKRTTINLNARIVGVSEIKGVEPKKNYRDWFNFRRFDTERILKSTFTLAFILTIIFGIYAVGFSNSNISVTPKFATAQVGGETAASIFVSDESFIEHIGRDQGIIKANFADVDSQPNITLTIQPNSFQSVPSAAKIRIRIGANAKPSLYKIVVEADKGFDKRTETMFVEVRANNESNSSI